MTSDTRVPEILDDARAYAEAGAFSGAVGVLAEDSEAVRGHAGVLPQAIALLDTCYYQLWLEKSAADALAAVDLIFALARGRLLPDSDIDPGILERYKRALIATGTSPLPLNRYLRHQNLIRVFALTAEISGDVVECGCARGLSSMELCLEIGRTRPDWRGKGFHIFDSFAGLSEPEAKDLDVTGIDAGEAQRILSMMHRGNMACSLAQVREAFREPYPDVAFHPGWIPDSFTGLPEQRYRFVHVDVDLYQPTLAALAYFFPRLQPGGVIATDDYNWPGGRQAVDEFCAANALRRQVTSTNQAYVVRER